MLVAAASPVAVSPLAPGDDVVVSRYNQERTGVATDIGRIVQPAILWTFKTNGTIATSPLAADVDGDGELEVFLGEYMPGGASDGSRLGYVLDARGNAQYTVPMPYNSVAAAAAELDGDAGMEIVFSMGSHADETGGLGYRVLNGEDGSALWSFDTANSPGEGFFASPALVDVDGDGGLDLIAGAMDDSVYALRGVDGTPLWQTPALGHYVRHSTPMADVDGDGAMEVTVQTEAGEAFLFDALTGAEEWRTDLGMIVAATPAIGDLDGDGDLEIVYSLVVDGGVVAVHGDGTILWRQTAHDFSYRSPTLVDVDGDGLVDVVEGDSNDPSVSAYRGTDGAILWETHLASSWASGALVSADVDGDGAMEIVVGSDLGLTVLSASTGAIEWELALPGTIRGEPLVRDIDGRGGAEILVGAGDGQLYVLGMPLVSVAATLRVEPRTLNLRSNGQWVNARVEFAEPIASLVDPSTLELEGVPADRVEVQGDATIHAKFSRNALIDVLSPGDAVEVCATGALTDGRPFQACDVIRVISPGP